MPKRERNKAVAYAVEILQAFHREQPELGAREIARRLGAAPAIVERILVVLCERGFLKNNGGRFTLGPAVVPLAYAYQSINRFGESIVSVLKSIRDETGETACFHIYSYRRRITVHQVESFQELRWVVDMGRSYPLHRGATGKVLLAHLPEDEQRAVLVDVYGPAWATDPSCQALLQELLDIRRQGWAITHGEREPGGVGVAVPVFTPVYPQPACLSVYAPEVRVTPAKAERFLERLRQGAEVLSQLR